MKSIFGNILYNNIFLEVHLVLVRIVIEVHKGFSTIFYLMYTNMFPYVLTLLLYISLCSLQYAVLCNMFTVHSVYLLYVIHSIYMFFVV